MTFQVAISPHHKVDKAFAAVVAKRVTIYPHCWNIYELYIFQYSILNQTEPANEELPILPLWTTEE